MLTFAILTASMGCSKITYDYREEGLEKSSVHFFGQLAQKRGQQKNRINYYPFGLTFNSYERTASTAQDYKFIGKEEQEWGVLDFGFRMYDAAIGRFSAIDPLADNSISMTPYHYAGNSPIAFYDADGLDWFFYKQDGEEEASWNWHDGDSYDRTVTYTDDDGNEQTKTFTLQGVDAAVVFEGYNQERLGEGDNLYGEGAITANVTVYGPDGPDDVQTYEGYTMSSDPNSYGVVANNDLDSDDNKYYSGNYDAKGKSGILKSNWVLNNRGEVAARNGVNPAYLDRDPGYLLGVFIHRSNKNGYAGSPVSQGCLLICPGPNGDGADWTRFNNQMHGVTNFAVQVTRTIHPSAYHFLVKKMFGSKKDK